MKSNTKYIYLSCGVPNNTRSTYQSAGLSNKPISLETKVFK